jgi:hypothetical protein
MGLRGLLEGWLLFFSFYLWLRSVIVFMLTTNFLLPEMLLIANIYGYGRFVPLSVPSRPLFQNSFLSFDLSYFQTCDSQGKWHKSLNEGTRRCGIELTCNSKVATE